MADLRRSEEEELKKLAETPFEQLGVEPPEISERSEVTFEDEEPEKFRELAGEGRLPETPEAVAPEGEQTVLDILREIREALVQLPNVLANTFHVDE